jgi:transposase-like protein
MLRLISNKTFSERVIFMAMTKEEKRKRALEQRGGLPEPGGKPRPPIRDREDCGQIEYDLASGKSVRAIAKKYNVHEGALYRHRKQLPPQLKAAYLANFLKPGEDLEKLKTQESESLLQNLAQQRARLLMMQDKALEDDDAQAVGTLAGRIHQNLEIVGKYLGELQQHSTKTIVNVLVSAEYLAMRNALVRALAPFPEARAAVAKVLHSMEGDAAQQITHPQVIDVPALPRPGHEEAA